MTRDQLRRAWQAIGWTAGWLDRRGWDYSITKFHRDLELLHPGIIGSCYHLRKAIKGLRPPKEAWDKVVLELLERATSGIRHPPEPGPADMPHRGKVLRVTSEKIDGLRELVKPWREARGLTLRGLARDSGISYSRLYRLEGAIGSLSPAVVVRPGEVNALCRALGVDLQRFLRGPGFQDRKTVTLVGQ